MSALTSLRWRETLPDTGRVIKVGFRLLGWIVVSLLAAAGLFVLMFATFGNFTLEGFFRQLANLSNRYGSAGAARRMQFGETLLVVSAVALGVTMVCRRSSLAQIFADRAED